MFSTTGKKKKKRKGEAHRGTHDPNEKRWTITEFNAKVKEFNVLFNQSLQLIKDWEIFTPVCCLHHSSTALRSLKS